MGCSQATLLSSIGIGMGVAQKSTLSTVYSGVDLGVSATTDKSIREHILGDGTTDTEGSHLTTTPVSYTHLTLPTICSV